MPVRNTVIIIRNAAPHDFGGGERVPVFIAREALQQSTIQPIIFSRSAKLINFAHTNHVPYKRTWWWSRQNWSGWRIALTPIYLAWQIILFAYYLTLFIKYRPHVVHIQSKDDFIAGTYAARLVGARVIWSDYADLKHIFRNHTIWYKNPIGKAVYLAAHLAEKIAVVSKEDKRLVIENIPNSQTISNKMHVVYNGAFDSYNPAIEKYKTFTFVSTGRLVTDKGVGELIEAFMRFNVIHKNSRLYLLGDGPERQKFEKKSQNHPAIHFLGYQQEPLNYVAKSHVFLLPTYHEGFSLALVEACMLGIPIIATNVGGNPEIIKDNNNGLLIKVKSIDDIYDSMVLLYKNKTLCKQLSKNARSTYVEKFDFAKIIKKEFLSLYSKDTA